MNIKVQFNDFCGNINFYICGNFKYPKIASAEGFELISCLYLPTLILIPMLGKHGLACVSSLDMVLASSSETLSAI